MKILRISKRIKGGLVIPDHNRFRIIWIGLFQRIANEFSLIRWWDDYHWMCLLGNETNKL